MSETPVRHETVVVSRRYAASPARVFAAFADSDLLARWYVPGDGSLSNKVLSHDFRVGGGLRTAFGTPEQTWAEDVHYTDIVADRRLCFAMTISTGDERMTTSMVTVELDAEAGGCALRLTDQAVLLDGDPQGALLRENGWGETLDKLPTVLGG